MAMMMELLKGKQGQSPDGGGGALTDLLGNINPQTIASFGSISEEGAMGGASGDPLSMAAGALGGMASSEEEDSEEEDEKTTGQKIGGAASGALEGAQIGSMAGPIGMGVGGLLGGLKGYFL